MFKKRVLARATESLRDCELAQLIKSGEDPILKALLILDEHSEEAQYLEELRHDTARLDNIISQQELFNFQERRLLKQLLR